MNDREAGKTAAQERKGETSSELLLCVHDSQRIGETAADHWWTAKPGRLGGGESTRSILQVGKTGRRQRRRHRRCYVDGGSIVDSGSGTSSENEEEAKEGGRGVTAKVV